MSEKKQKDVQTCEEQVDEKDQKIKELTEVCQRIQADFENYKRRQAEERQQTALFYKRDIIEKLLPSLDMFELALKHTDDKEEFVKGMEMIYSQFLSALENEGLEVIKEQKEFDGSIHEAVITEESDEPDGTILEELQKGYKLDNQVIRYTRVKVAKKEEN